MTPTIENAKSRIRKLLNVTAENGAATGEIENAMAAAQRLMDEHRLTEAEIAQDATDADPTAGYDVKSVYGGGDGRTVKWEAWLCLTVERIVGGIGVYSKGVASVRSEATGFATGKRAGHFVFFGDGESIEIAAELYNELRSTIAPMATGLYGNCYRGEGRSYAEGFVAGIDRKIAETTKERTAEATALVLVGSERATTWLAKAHGVKLKTRSTRANGGHSAEAHGRGVRDGQSQDVTVSRRAKLAGSAGLLT